MNPTANSLANPAPAPGHERQPTMTAVQLHATVLLRRAGIASASVCAAPTTLGAPVSCGTTPLPVMRWTVPCKGTHDALAAVRSRLNVRQAREA